MTVTLANATLASLSPPTVSTGNVNVDGDRIVAARHIGQGVETSVDCSGTIVMPGNVCAHTHLYSALARGMPPPPRAPRNFLEILELIWWRLDCALDEASIHASTLSGILDAIRCGTTTLVDHHASPNCIDGSLDIMAQAFETVGARGVLCYEVTDRGGSERRIAGLRENERFVRAARANVRGMIGAHASFTLDDGTLDALAEMARRLRTGVHVHVAEDACDEDDSLQRCGKRVAARLHDAGIVTLDSIAAHGVHLDNDEIGQLLGDGAWLVHNCRSNLNNRVGRAPVDRFGDSAALGTDGIDGDMFSESRTAFFRARETSLDSDAARYTAMLTAGARLASRFFDFPLGTLEAGAGADLIVLDYDPPTPLTPGNLAWHWMFGMHAGLVRDVMIGGQWVIRDREFVTVDEEKVRADARSEAVSLWKRMETM